jgi:hypothetical protein
LLSPHYPRRLSVVLVVEGRETASGSILEKLEIRFESAYYDDAVPPNQFAQCLKSKIDRIQMRTIILQIFPGPAKSATLRRKIRSKMRAAERNVLHDWQPSRRYKARPNYHHWRLMISGILSILAICLRDAWAHPWSPRTEKARASCAKWTHSAAETSLCSF